MFYGSLENKLSLLIKRSVNHAIEHHNLPSIPHHIINVQLEFPKERAHGDLSTNIAMRTFKYVNRSPVEFAILIMAEVKASLKSIGLMRVIENVEVKDPGFINFFLTKSFLYKALLDIIRKKSRYGSSGVGRKEKTQVEFVSANPTGPLTIAHGRQAAVGDALANVLEFCGYRAKREYYINDEGRQINLLGASIRHRYRELFGIKEELPPDGYKGAYIVDIAKAFRARYDDRHLDNQDVGIFSRFGYRKILTGIRRELKRFGVRFDIWYSQKELRESGKLKKALLILEDKDLVYEKDGAVWFKSTKFGDDKDRVIFKSDKTPTYLAPDIAYHFDKYKRGFRRVINIWGPDHHGYIARMKAAVKALGYGDSYLRVLIVQLVTLFRKGQPLSMSTRAGEFITLKELMDEVGEDVTRFCFLLRKLDSHLDFDLDAVKARSLENPVYYIQYAHARIWSIYKYGKHIKHSRFNSRLLKEEEELELLRMLRRFPIVVQLCAKFLEPHGIVSYLQELASCFHSFYEKFRVVGDDKALTRARLVLVDCVRIVLASGLRLLGVSLQKRM